MKREPQVDEEGMFEPRQDLDFPKDVLEGVALDTLVLVHVLHGKHLFSVFLLNYAHLEMKKERHVNTLDCLHMYVRVYVDAYERVGSRSPEPGKYCIYNEPVFLPNPS